MVIKYAHVYQRLDGFFNTEKVIGSNPIVSTNINYLYAIVPEWNKGAVCKTALCRFESCRWLHFKLLRHCCSGSK